MYVESSLLPNLTKRKFFYGNYCSFSGRIFLLRAEHLFIWLQCYEKCFQVQFAVVLKRSGKRASATCFFRNCIFHKLDDDSNRSLWSMCNTTKTTYDFSVIIVKRFYNQNKKITLLTNPLKT